MSDRAAFNRELGRRINLDIWNGRQFDKLADYFTDDFEAVGLQGTRRGLDALRANVESAHASFEGFREELISITADDERVVVHFTIRGRHTGPWGPLPATGKDVAFDEIVIMSVRGDKVCRQVGVADNITGLRQVGFLPTPRSPE